MAATALSFLLLELFRVIVGMNIYSEDCFVNRYCFSLIFNQGVGASNLTDAQNSCRNIRSSLAEIRESQIQSYATEFLRNASRVSIVLTHMNVLINAQRYDNKTWFWVNGEALETNITDNGIQTVARICRRNNSSVIDSASPTESNGYICEYPNTTHSPHNCTFNHKGRCFVVDNSIENWFGARNRCLPNGDLASLDWIAIASDLHLLNSSAWLNQTTRFWIGLQKSRWIWEGSKTEVKYTSWKNDTQQFNSTNKCVSLSYNSTPVGQWTTTNCNSTPSLHYLCLHVVKRNKTTVGISTTNATMGNVTHASSASDANTLALGLGVGLGLCVVLLTIVVVILVVFIIRRRLLNSNNTSSQTSPSSENQAKSKPRNHIPYYTQVQKHKRDDGSTSGDNSAAATSAESAKTSESQTSCAEVRRDQTTSAPVAHDDFLERQPVYINVDITQ